MPIIAASRSPKARPTSSISQPPIDDPISTTGPSANASIIASTSSRQMLKRLIGKIAFAQPAPGIVKQQAGAAILYRPFEHRTRLAARHVGHIAGQKDNRRAQTIGPAIGEF